MGLAGLLACDLGAESFVRRALAVLERDVRWLGLWSLLDWEATRVVGPELFLSLARIFGRSEDPAGEVLRPHRFDTAAFDGSANRIATAEGRRMRVWQVEDARRDSDSPVTGRRCGSAARTASYAASTSAPTNAP